MTRFNEAKKDYLPRLKQFVPVVARVHGGSHPEFHKVAALFAKINEKINTAEDLSSEFEQLRQITENYTVPGDVCESYAAVYNMLAALDEAYRAES